MSELKINPSQENGVFRNLLLQGRLIPLYGHHGNIQPPPRPRTGGLAFLVSLSMTLSACGSLGTPPPTIPPAPTVTSIPVSALLPSGTPFQPAFPTSTSIPTPTQPPVFTATPGSTDAPSALSATAVYQSNFPDTAGYSWTRITSGLELPVDIQSAGDGSGRLFIVEKRGRILIFQNGSLLGSPFLDIQDKVDSQNIEEGLLGLAFHPHYTSSGLFYVNYVDLNGNTVIASFHVSTNNPNRADPASEVDLLHVNQPYSNHKGGGLAFGPDGYLYIGLGDGGSEGDPLRNGQNLQTLLGKMLRINVDAGVPFAIPSDNPFARAGGSPEIWAFGLRNPWRFSFDRLTGGLYIGDVGQDTWEEIDFVPSGAPGGLNFGWSNYEGNHPYHDQPPASTSFTFPVAEYSHANGCAVTGGYVYRGVALPAWQGVYVYGDYCSGIVWGLIHSGPDSWQTKILFHTGAAITTFGEDDAGELYLSDYNTGSILQLVRK